MSPRARVIALLNNSSFVFIVAIAVGLGLSGGAASTEHALVPVLALVMTVSIMDISSRVFLHPSKVWRPVVVALVLNFVILSGTYIGMSYLLIDDVELHRGFVLIAAVPSAVAVVPLTLLLGGNTRFALLGTVALYGASLAVTPLISLVFLGSSYIDLAELLVTLAELIVAPIVVSRLLRRTPVAPRVERWRGPVVNWGFFLVIYTLVGLNRDVFFEDPGVLLHAAAVVFVAIYVVAEVVNFVSARMGVTAADRISLMMLATRKNGGAAAAIALIFFDPRAAVPVAVMTAISVSHFIWLTWRVRWIH
jgi:BASS family bile acid:Na+ symporter